MNREALEEKIAMAKRNRKESGNKYGGNLVLSPSNLGHLLKLFEQGSECVHPSFTLAEYNRRTFYGRWLCYSTGIGNVGLASHTNNIIVVSCPQYHAPSVILKGTMDRLFTINVDGIPCAILEAGKKGVGLYVD